MHIATTLAAHNASGYNDRMFRPRHLSRLLFALSLAGVLLFAQWLLVQHGANLEPHASNHACEWCLAHTPLTGALPVTAAVMMPLPAPLFPVSLLRTSITGDPPSAYVARAPPRSFPV